MDAPRRLRVYLGGPINGCTDDEANGWRDKFRALLPGVEFVDPMVRDYRGREDQFVNEIVELDKEDIVSCDIVLIYGWQASWGSAMELAYAEHKNKTVIAVIPDGTRISPWVRYHSTLVCPTLESAAAAIVQLSEGAYA